MEPSILNAARPAVAQRMNDIYEFPTDGEKRLVKLVEVTMATSRALQAIHPSTS
jgi:hypothetical protein